MLELGRLQRRILASSSPSQQFLSLFAIEIDAKPVRFTIPNLRLSLWITSKDEPARPQKQFTVPKRSPAPRPSLATVLPEAQYARTVQRRVEAIESRLGNVQHILQDQCRLPGIVTAASHP